MRKVSNSQSISAEKVSLFVLKLNFCEKNAPKRFFHRIPTPDLQIPTYAPPVMNTDLHTNSRSRPRHTNLLPSPCPLGDCNYTWSRHSTPGCSSAHLASDSQRRRDNNAGRETSGWCDREGTSSNREKYHSASGRGSCRSPLFRPRLRKRMNIELNFPLNFEGLVLGGIDADFCK